MKCENIKRAWVISDLHFGVHSSNIEWIEIGKDYYNNFFFPLVDKEKEEGDCCLILGDVFESRQSINILVMNEAHKIVKEIASRMPVFILVGNHDCYRKNTTETNSLIAFKDIDNVTIIESDVEIEFANKSKALFIPWVEDKKEMQEKLKTAEHHEYLFLHEDFSGMKSSAHSVVPGGLPYAIVNNFDNVYSGHIHYGQKIKNVTMVGTPFATSRSDVDNDKYVYLLDFENRTEEKFLNDYSPKFMKLDLEEAKAMKDADLKKLVNNNFVDIVVDTTKVKSFDYEDFADNLNESKRIEFKPTASLTEEEEEIVVESNLTNESLIDSYVEKLSYNDKIKEKLKETAKRILKKAQEA